MGPTMSRDSWLAWLFLAPAVLLVAVLMYYPMVGTVMESLYDSSFINPVPRFDGLASYARTLASGEFMQVAANSVVWTAGVVALQNLVGFATALLLNQRLPGQAAARSLILLPWVLPGVVAAILWRFMLDPQLGLINSFLIRAGLVSGPIAWLANPDTALPAAILAAVWKGFPFSTVVYLAALQDIDHELIEAARIDGARAWRRLTAIVLPSIRETVVINVILTAILTFNYFDMIWVLTRGGPQNATAIFPTKIYELGFGQFRFGEAAVYGVLSIMLLLVLLAASAMVRRSVGQSRAVA
jgi:multiple sugar transport system permease protein